MRRGRLYKHLSNCKAALSPGSCKSGQSFGTIVCAHDSLDEAVSWRCFCVKCFLPSRRLHSLSKSSMRSLNSAYSCQQGLQSTVHLGGYKNVPCSVLLDMCRVSGCGDLDTLFLSFCLTVKACTALSRSLSAPLHLWPAPLTVVRCSATSPHQQAVLGHSKMLQDRRARRHPSGSA